MIAGGIVEIEVILEAKVRSHVGTRRGFGRKETTIATLQRQLEPVTVTGRVHVLTEEAPHTVPSTPPMEDAI